MARLTCSDHSLRSLVNAIRSKSRSRPGPSNTPPRLRTTTTRKVALEARLASTSLSNRDFIQSGSAGKGTRMRAASRCMRSQCRSNANSTPFETRMVLKTPHPLSRPTCPTETLFSCASRTSSLCRRRRCMIHLSGWRGGLVKSLPVREGINPPALGVANEVRNKLAAAHQFHQQSIERSFVAFHPLRRDLFTGLVDNLLWKVNHAVEPGLKIVPGG